MVICQKCVKLFNIIDNILFKQNTFYLIRHSSHMIINILCINLLNNFLVLYFYIFTYLILRQARYSNRVYNMSRATDMFFSG